MIAGRRIYGGGQMLMSQISRRPSGLRKTNPHYNSLAHKTKWLWIMLKSGAKYFL